MGKLATLGSSTSLALNFLHKAQDAKAFLTAYLPWGIQYLLRLNSVRVD